MKIEDLQLKIEQLEDKYEELILNDELEYSQDILNEIEKLSKKLTIEQNKDRTKQRQNSKAFENF